MTARLELEDTSRTLYTRVAFYYYKRGLTQEEIAKRLKMSRQRVNRILGECEELGIVEIRVAGDSVDILELESQLEKKYGLTAARVVSVIGNEDINTALGLQAGHYLAEILRDHDVIGFSRGSTLSSLVNHMPVINRQGLVATQLMGGWNRLHNTEGCDDIVHVFSTRMRATANILYAPVVVRDAMVRSTIMREPFYVEAYKVMNSCTVVVLGIGQVKNQNMLPALKEEDIQLYLDCGAVGEICARFYDVAGKPVETFFDERILAITRDDLLKIPLRIGVAGTEEKIQAVIGAVKGGYVNALVTDIKTARALCTA